MNISQQFSPPLKLIIPFFLLGVGALVVSIALLFGFDVTQVHLFSSTTIAWVHLFALGFVMMVILGAMAQLIPVVLEVEHFAVELYYAIYPLLLVGVVMMGGGFLLYPLLLPFGGVVVLIAFGIYLVETFLTLTKVKRITFVVVAVLLANIFLLFGLIVAFMMALGYAGMVAVDIQSLVKLHVYLVVFGYVGVSIMGMSAILLPMFMLSHIKSWRVMKSALSVLTVALLLLAVSIFLHNSVLEKSVDGLILVAFFLYAYQIVMIYKIRMRIEADIYFKSMVFSYISFFVVLFALGVSVLVDSQQFVFLIGWIGFGGFITFLISGHLYKIVPFLVWYEKFSPLVGKQKVPMLAEMVPKRSSNMQFLFSSVGVVVIAFAIMLANEVLFKSGVSFLLFGVIFLAKDMIYMMRYK